MAKVLKRSDLSKKDYSVDTGVLRVKDSVFNIISDIGNGDKADFNEADPLLYWAAPANPKVGAVAHVLFNDGLAYYSYDGVLWSLNFFYPSSAYISPVVTPLVYKALLTQSGTDAPVATVLKNTLGDVPTWIRTDVGIYEINLTDAFPPDKTLVHIDYNGQDLRKDLRTEIKSEKINSNTIIFYVGEYTFTSPDIFEFMFLDGPLFRANLTIEVYP